MFCMSCIWTVRMIKYDRQATCATVNRNLNVHKMVIYVCREDEVRKRDLDEEKNVTDLEERN